MMFAATQVCFLILAVIATQTLAQKIPEVDEMDIEKTIVDKEKMDAFFDCLLEVTKDCSDENVMWKEILPTLYATECAECSEKHKEVFVKANKLLRENYPGKYDELLKKMKEKSLK